MFHRFPGRLQQQPLLRVDRGGLALAETEELGIETADFVQISAPARYRPAGHTLFGVVIFVDVPPVGGDIGDQVVAAQQRVPQQFRGVDTAGKPTGHSDDGNGNDRSVNHGDSPSSVLVSRPT